MVSFADRASRRSSLAMALLLLLDVEPMHPYGLRQRIKEWDKDRFINVSQRNAIYQTIDRLQRSGLITLKETTRQEKRPDRMVYEATGRGVATAKQWLTEMLATPPPEYADFPAALSFLPVLPPGTVLDALRARLAQLEQNIETLEAEVAAGVARIPGGVDRIHLIEVDYQKAMWSAESAWVRDLIGELSTREKPFTRDEPSTGDELSTGDNASAAGQSSSRSEPR